MQDQIKNFLSSFLNGGNASEQEDMFNSIMSQKAIGALDNARMEIAKDMFATAEQEATEE